MYMYIIVNFVMFFYVSVFAPSGEPVSDHVIRTYKKKEYYIYKAIRKKKLKNKVTHLMFSYIYKALTDKSVSTVRPDMTLKSFHPPVNDMTLRRFHPPDIVRYSVFKCLLDIDKHVILKPLLTHNRKPILYNFVYKWFVLTSSRVAPWAVLEFNAAQRFKRDHINQIPQGPFLLPLQPTPCTQLPQLQQPPPQSPPPTPPYAQLNCWMLANM
jgi:hypothetical protein